MTSISSSAATSTMPLGEIQTGGAMGTSGTAPLDTGQVQLPTRALKVSAPLKMPTGVSSNCKQLVVLACDVSSSMKGQSKIDNLNVARTSLIQVLALPENKDGFIGCIVDFNHKAQTIVPPQSVVGMTVPVSKAGGGTNFNSAALECIRIVEGFNSQENPDGYRFIRPIVIKLSDGHAQISDKNIQALQEIATVITVAYGVDADQAALARIASDGQVHVVGTQGDQLRKFLADVGKTLSQDLAKA